MEQKITKWESQSPKQLDQELRSLDNEINQLFRQIDEIKKERTTVSTIMKNKRLDGNQFALLATCNEPPDDDDDDSWDIEEWQIKTQKTRTIATEDGNSPTTHPTTNTKHPLHRPHLKIHPNETDAPYNKLWKTKT